MLENVVKRSEFGYTREWRYTKVIYYYYYTQVFVCLSVNVRQQKPWWWVRTQRVGLQMFPGACTYWHTYKCNAVHTDIHTSATLYILTSLLAQCCTDWHTYKCRAVHTDIHTSAVLYILTYIQVQCCTYWHTYKCSATCYSGSCTPTSEMSITEFRMSWRLQ